jgi:hypothetical protein
MLWKCDLTCYWYMFYIGTLDFNNTHMHLLVGSSFATPTGD